MNRRMDGVTGRHFFLYTCRDDLRHYITTKLMAWMAKQRRSTTGHPTLNREERAAAVAIVNGYL